MDTLFAASEAVEKVQRPDEKRNANAEKGSRKRKVYNASARRLGITSRRPHWSAKKHVQTLSVQNIVSHDSFAWHVALLGSLLFASLFLAEQRVCELWCLGPRVNGKGQSSVLWHCQSNTFRIAFVSTCRLIDCCSYCSSNMPDAIAKAAEQFEKAVAQPPPVKPPAKTAAKPAPAELPTSPAKPPAPGTRNKRRRADEKPKDDDEVQDLLSKLLGALTARVLRSVDKEIDKRVEQRVKYEVAKRFAKIVDLN
jgi:hypothetical protein